jgi:hypothetical protein
VEALQTFFESMLTEDRWPFWSAVLVLAILGQFSSLKLFTRERAYGKTTPRWVQHLWWWGRETLMLHPIAAGALLGTLWLDPEGKGWPLVGSAMYFATAGVVSMFAFAVLRGFLKWKGIPVQLPGTSEPPAPPVQLP